MIRGIPDPADPRLLPWHAGFRLRPAALALTTTLCLGIPGLAAADANGEDDADAETAAVTLDTLMVTARRSKEMAKDVPFSVTTVTREEIEDRRLQSLDQLIEQTPGVDFVSNMGLGERNVRIRGIGSIQRTSIDDTAVVINLDGLPLSATNATMSLLDVDQVEVLKGPQGTLFGRNSEAGAINIRTRLPTRWLEGYIRGEIGEDNHYMTEGAVGGPLTETLSGRIAVRTSHIDSNVSNLETGDPVTEPRAQTARGSLLWEPTEATSLLLTASYSDQRDGDLNYVLYPYGDTAKAEQDPDIRSDENEAVRFTAEFTHEFEDMVLTILSAYSNASIEGTSNPYEGLSMREAYGMPFDARITTESDQTLWNEEIRLSSRESARIFWVAGANYYRSEHTWDTHDSYNLTDPTDVYNGDMDRDFTTDATAIFGETTIPMPRFERLKFTLGARYTWEDKDVDAHWVPNAYYGGSFGEAWDSDTFSDDYMTGRVAVGYELTPDTNLYAMYSRGHKSGGFVDFANMFAMGGTDEAYKSASIDTYETGFKFESADGRFGLNGAVFLNDVKDDHVLLYDYATNTASAENHDTESKGVELEGLWRATDELTLRASVTYLDTEIKVEGGTSASGIEDGNEMPEVPKWAATLSLNYIKPLPAFFGLSSPILKADLTNNYVGSRAASAWNIYELSSYNKLDLRVGLEEKGMEVYLWAKNLLDQEYDLFGYYLENYMTGGYSRIGYPGRGRTLGIGVSYLF